MNNIEEKVRVILERVTENKLVCELGNDDDIYKELSVSSLQMIQLVVEVEEAFHIELDDSELGYQAFSTIEGLCGIIQQHLAN